MDSFIARLQSDPTFAAVVGAGALVVILLLLVFWKDGYSAMLEGASCGDDTSAVDFATVAFKLV